MCFTCNPHQLVIYELLLTTGPLVFVYAFMGTLPTPVNTEGAPLYFHRIMFSSYEAFSDFHQEYFQLIPIHQPRLRKGLELPYWPRK